MKSFVDLEIVVWRQDTDRIGQHPVVADVLRNASDEDLFGALIGFLWLGDDLVSIILHCCYYKLLPSVTINGHTYRMNISNESS